MKVVTVVGARPQFIKAGVVSRQFRKKGTATEVLIHTGQHYDENMSSVFFDELEIPEPDYNLGVGSGGHGMQTGRMLEAIERVLLDEAPDWVLVYGDTNSTLAGALAAAKLNVPVAHVEAGLRSFNRRMPEEVNRVMADHVSDMLFAPTQAATKNLAAEGIARERVHLVGDVMYDAALFYGGGGDRETRLLDSIGFAGREYVLATIHRAENTDDPARLGAIFEGLSDVARAVPVVMPLHPRTRRILNEMGWFPRLPPGFHAIDPLGYLQMVVAEKNARLIVTDSGGVQKEAYFHGVPCVTLRDETEWVELVESGWNRLVPPASAANVRGCIESMLDFAGQVERRTLYGEGDSGERIVDILTGKAAFA